MMYFYVTGNQVFVITMLSMEAYRELKEMGFTIKYF